jgi:hypothetical protein
MVNCSYCNGPIDRQVFCSSSHKVMYHRHGAKVLTKGKQENPKQLTKGKQKSPSIDETSTPIQQAPCRHGNHKDMCHTCLAEAKL